MQRVARSIVLAILFCACSATSAFGVVWQVPGDNSNTCTIGVPSCDTIAAAVAAATGGDTISIDAGTFSGAGNFGVIVDKSLTITGAGRAATTISPGAGNIGLSVRSSDVSISDLAIDGGSHGIRFDTASNNTHIDRVDLRNTTSRGIEFATNQPVIGVAIDDCTFTSVNIGIRMASTSQVDGLTITNSTFNNSPFGIYQANDGGTSTLVDLHISDTTFTGHTQYAIYVEELRDATITDSVFTNNRVGFLLLKLYSGSGVAASNIAIERNQFIGQTFTAIDLEIYTFGLETGATIADNEFDMDVSTLVGNASGIFVALSNTLTHAPVTISGNIVHMSGTFGAATAAFGIRFRRNGPVVLTGNVLDGGDVGGSGTTPATSGIYIESRNSATAAMPATTTVEASCNRITGFRNGVSVFDSFNAVYGGLAAGASVTLEDNAIAGNSDFGLQTGDAPSESIVAANNFWGCAEGPGNPGCDDVTGNVESAPVAAEVAPCVGCAEDVDCTDPCLAMQQCVDGACSGTPIPGCGDHYISYQAKAQKKDLAKQLIPDNLLDKNFALTVDDTLIDDANPDDPENFVVLKPRNLLIPARPDTEPAVLWPDVSYVRYSSRSAKEGIGAVLPNGKYPKPAKHVPRTFSLENEFGTVEVISKKVSAFLVPAGASTDTPDPNAPTDATHYQCYKVKPTDSVTDQTPDAGKGAGKFRKDLQAFFAEELFSECATTADGSVGFEGESVEGMCLFDVRVPTELCNPADTDNVAPDRTTSAAIDPATAQTARSLLCYRVKPSKKVLNDTVGAILGLQVRDKLAKPKKVPKRGIKTGDALYVTPGNSFPAPSLLDTKAQQSVCVPTTVVSVE